MIQITYIVYFSFPTLMITLIFCLVDTFKTFYSVCVFDAKNRACQHPGGFMLAGLACVSRIVYVRCVLALCIFFSFNP